jgi:hypothetical protein
MSTDRRLCRAEHSNRVIWRSARQLQMASVAALFLFIVGAAVAAEQPGEATTQSSALVLDGKVKHPQRFSVDVLRRLPAERVEVSFQTAQHYRARWIYGGYFHSHVRLYK